jgi:hypothetical protein
MADTRFPQKKLGKLYPLFYNLRFAKQRPAW